MGDFRLSPLDAEHRTLGAHMGAFAGWDMPISYAGTVSEHNAVRSDAGVFDVSHLGKIWIRGEGARALADRALTNGYDNLEPGRARYTLMLTEDAGIVDDMIVYAFGDFLLVVPNAANVDEVERRLKATEGADALDVMQSGEAIIALQGPRSQQVLNEVIKGVPPLDYMHCAFVDQYAICRSGYTGEHGYEIFCRPDDAPGVWKAILDCGVIPAGLAARDTLRLEMGYPLHGNDIDDATMPSEAGLMWAVGKTKASFAGAEALRSRAPRKALAGIVMNDRVIPRSHCEVRDGSGNRIGEVTSGTFSPTRKIGIALAYVEPGSVQPGDDVAVEVRGKIGHGSITKPPFVASSPK